MAYMSLKFTIKLRYHASIVHLLKHGRPVFDKKLASFYAHRFGAMYTIHLNNFVYNLPFFFLQATSIYQGSLIFSEEIE